MPDSACPLHTRLRSVPTAGMALAFLTLLAAVLACNLPSTSRPQQVLIPVTTLPTITPSPAALPSSYIPLAARATFKTSTQLAYLRDGDVWMKDVVQNQETRLTQIGGLTGFAWAPSGDRLAAFDGKVVYLARMDGFPDLPAFNLKIPAPQVETATDLFWTPDEKLLVVSYMKDPWEGAKIGWFVLSLDGSGHIERIPGRVGKLLYLPDGDLLGTVTESCGGSGCALGLYRFEPQTGSSKPYSLDGFSQKGGVGILEIAAGQQYLTHPNTAHMECMNYAGSYEALKLDPRAQADGKHGKDMLYDFSLSPDGNRILIARGVGCSGDNQAKWTTQCWLDGGPDVYTMVLWDWQTGSPKDLLPGIFPDWSPGGDKIAFRSCLARTPSGEWVATQEDPPWIFVMDANGDPTTILQVSPGSYPSWRPFRP